MTDYQEFIQQIFQDQYVEQFGPGELNRLEPQGLYLKREIDGDLAALLHAQQVLENIHVKALVVEKNYQGRGLGASCWLS